MGSHSDLFLCLRRIEHVAFRFAGGCVWGQRLGRLWQARAIALPDEWHSAKSNVLILPVARCITASHLAEDSCGHKRRPCFVRALLPVQSPNGSAQNCSLKVAVCRCASQCTHREDELAFCEREGRQSALLRLNAKTPEKQSRVTKAQCSCESTIFANGWVLNSPLLLLVNCARLR
eukprot:6203598-Pleurochrysis_carterae.AAC.2